MDDKELALALVETDDPYVRLAKLCRRIRNYYNLTQHQLAEKLNMSPRSIQYLEHASHSTGFDTLYLFCKTFGVDPRIVLCPDQADIPDYQVDLMQLTRSCSEQEAAILTPIVASALSALRSNIETA